LSLDVFLESGDEFDREAAEAALARNGLATDSTVTTADGGEASVSVDDDGVVLVISALTPELVDVIFDVAAGTRLAILPVDGTPTAYVAGEASVPDDLDAVDVPDAGALFEGLRRSEELRGARKA
jgi:hypothetical protein